MPHLDHSLWHNTFIYASDNRDEKLGGLWAGCTFTNANLYSMVEILYIFSKPFNINDKDGQLLGRDGGQLQVGDYYIVTPGSITVNNEVPMIRWITTGSGPRTDAFCKAVRARDGGCVISGIEAPLAYLGNWVGYEACHIFPLAYEQYWKQFNYARWITVPPANDSDGSINSGENGIMLSSIMHKFFDAYQISINPNDRHKIVCFSPSADPYHIPGRSLGQMFLDNPLRPPDQLLRWHFRQAVLINMKGAGGYHARDDSPPDRGMVGAVECGERAVAGVGGGLLGTPCA